MSDVFQPSTPREAYVVTTCGGKASYASPQLAHRRLREMHTKSKRKHKTKRGANDVYRCTVCHLWHLGGKR